MSRERNDSPCSVEGCDRVQRCKGLCQMHGTRLRRHGDPRVVLVGDAVPRAKRKPAKKLQPGQRISDSLSMPVEGPPTLEQWRRMQAVAAAPVHIVRHQMNASGIVA